MSRMLLMLFMLFVDAEDSNSQPFDSMQAEIVGIDKLTECDLIGVVSTKNKSDTIVLISPHKPGYTKDMKKLYLGKSYFFVFEEDVVIASPPKKISVEYKDTVLWTNKEPYRLKPKLCLNCRGEYVKCKQI